MSLFHLDSSNSSVSLVIICILCACALYIANSDLTLLRDNVMVEIRHDDSQAEKMKKAKINVQTPVYKMDQGQPHDNTISLKSNADPLEPMWAYFDPRFNRITILLLSIYAEGQPAYCHYLTANGTKLSGTAPFKTRVSPEYLLHCENGVNAPFVTVTKLGRLEGNTAARDMIRVGRVPGWDNKRRPLAICLAPIFGHNVLWPLLLQFVSAHQRFGASYFYFYILNESDNATTALLDHFVANKIGEIIYLPTKLKHNARCINVHRCRHNFQINDCVFRTLNRFELAAAIDIDDMLVPADTGKNWPQVIRESDPNKKYGAFCLRNRWIWAGITYREDEMFSTDRDNGTKLGMMPMMQFHNTTAYAPPGHTSKCLVRPESVLLMGVHRVWRMAEPYTTLWAPKTLGSVRHYRNTTSWHEKHKMQATNMGSMSNTSLPQSVERDIVLLADHTLQQIRRGLLRGEMSTGSDTNSKLADEPTNDVQKQTWNWDRNHLTLGLDVN